MKSIKLQPILKWAGGKRQLLDKIEEHRPKEFNNYFEPFLGGGAVLFDLRPKKAIVNDINEELINVYLTVKKNPYELINFLEAYDNSEETFYYVRNIDRFSFYKQMDPIFKASRIIYLNKTCYNGLYRVNKKGEFNVPYGKYKKPDIVNKEGILKMSLYLNENDIKFLCGDYRDALKTASEGDFVYLDPPYDPISKSSSFTSYNNNGFGKNDQEKLYETFCELTKRKCKVLLSNSATDYILDLYKDFNIVDDIYANRSINSKGDARNKVKEVLVKNYE